MTAKSLNSPTLFDRMSARYERYAEITDDIYRPWLSAAVPYRADDAASGADDLGCGSGRFDDLLSERYARVLAVDAAEGQIAIARARRPHPNVRYETRGIMAVTADRDGRFDLV
jgi:2-polyprenyl-3-methyl-5-hydroxy-6-metoxy-1,4-benzoquinol methylase